MQRQTDEPAGASGSSHEIDRAALGLFRRSTIRVRLTIAFLSITIVIVALGLIGAWQLQELANVAARQPSADVLAAATRRGQTVMVGFALAVFVLCFVF